jgi:hypothetical protein
MERTTSLILTSISVEWIQVSVVHGERIPIIFRIDMLRAAVFFIAIED